MTGFTYNGVHCEDLGLYYIPTKDEQWFPDPEYDVYDTDVSWRHGGIYYTSKAKVRTFNLKCYFEEIDVAKRQAIKEWVRRDTSGTLVFDDMPFVYWNVRPAKIPVGNWYLDYNESHSGSVTISFNAYEPFGYLTRKSNTTLNPGDNSEAYVHFLLDDDMPPEPTTSSTTFKIYNPGMEVCGLSIEVAGTTDNPFRFFNEQNGTYCEFNSIPSGLVLAINGDTGFVDVHVANTSLKENGFAYHNNGVVRLEPNIGGSSVSFINGTISGTEYQFDLVGYAVTNELRGATITLDSVPGSELTVSSVNPSNNRVWCTSESQITMPATGTCTVSKMNKINIQEKVNGSWTSPSTLSLTYIKTDYKPRAL